MSFPLQNDDANLKTRREMLRQSGMGMGLLGLGGLMADEALADTSSSVAEPMLPRPTHHQPKAKRVIHVFLNGGPSHVDTFDPKPLLGKYNKRSLPKPTLETESPTGAAFASPFKFRKHGQSGLEMSDLFPELGKQADHICVIRSMHSDVPNHERALMMMNCGDNVLARPSVGSWLTYGIGSENQNLPGFVALCPEGLPVKGTDNWRSAFLPGIFQGTYVNSSRRDIRELIENIDAAQPSIRQRRHLELLQKLNRTHLAQRSGDDRLEARIQSFETAYRMQTEAVEAFDAELEPDYIHEMYGTGTHARQMIVARRLVERGVRFVQVWHGEGQPWDSHENLPREHRRLSRQMDQPLAALLQDLEQRGLLEETLVVIGGEFGRTPTAQGGNGRDHNHFGFSVCLAGGGVRGGLAHGATDEFGWKATEDPVHVHDLHATMLHLMGLDHMRLTFRHAGRDFRLTDVHGNVVKAILA